MASILFERGKSTSTQKAVKDGKITYKTDTSELYFDVGNKRQEINANDAKTLSGASLIHTDLQYNKERIPSSYLLKEKLNTKISANIDDTTETLNLWSVKIHKVYLGESVSIQCEENMTWGEWVNSPYSSQVDLYVSLGDSGSIILTHVAYEGGASFNPSDIININGYSIFHDCCFVAGTQILIDNNQTMNIEDVRSGDSVMSYNIETGENYLTTVKKLVLNKHSTHMAKIIFDDGNILEMTDYHPLYTINGWSSLTDKKYNQLKIGDLVKTQNGWSEIIDIIQYTLKEPITTYTLDVRDNDEMLVDNEINDNFYANGIVAHNAACPA